MKSKLFTLNLSDFYKGLLIATLVAGLTTIKEMVEAGGIVGIDWMLVINSGVIASLAYLVKNLSTNSGDKVLIQE